MDESKPKPKIGKPASAPASADDNKIRFKCQRCGAKLKVPTKLAGKYMDCPKCKNRTPVPLSQSAADEDVRDYHVNKMAYEVPKACTKCGEKMKKGAVLCVNCGYDYREGKQLEVVDRTHTLGENVTYQQILNAPFHAKVGTLAMEVAGTVIPMMLGAAALLGILFAVQYFGFSGDETMAKVVVLGTSILVVAVHIVASTLILRASVSAASELALGTSTDLGSLLNYGINWLAITVIAGAPGSIVGAIFRNDEVAAPALILGLLCHFWAVLYLAAAIGTLAIDGTLNPLAALEWIGKTFVDLVLVVLYSTFLLAILVGAPIGGAVYFAMAFEDFAIAYWTIAGMGAVVTVVLGTYWQVGFAAAVGMVFLKHGDLTKTLVKSGQQIVQEEEEWEEEEE